MWTVTTPRYCRWIIWRPWCPGPSGSDRSESKLAAAVRIAPCVSCRATPRRGDLEPHREAIAQPSVGQCWTQEPSSIQWDPEAKIRVHFRKVRSKARTWTYHELIGRIAIKDPKLQTLHASWLSCAFAMWKEFELQWNLTVPTSPNERSFLDKHVDFFYTPVVEVQRTLLQKTFVEDSCSCRTLL